MRNSDEKGFTKVELVVALAVIGILVALAIPAIQKTREAAARTQIINNLKQCSLALHSCNDVNRKLPPAAGIFGSMLVSRSLSIHLIPYIESGPLYTYILDNSPPSTVTFPPFIAPLDFTARDGQRVQNFGANLRVFTFEGVDKSATYNVGYVPTDLTGGSAIPRTFEDGTQNTIVFACRYANSGTISGGGNVTCTAYDAISITAPGAWFGAGVLPEPATATSPGGWQLAPTLSQVHCDNGATAHSFGSGGLQVGMGDGSVRTVSPSISTETWNRAAQPNDGNELDSDWDH